MLNWLRNRWRDPVWSKVIAAAVVAMAGVAVKTLGAQITGAFRQDAVLFAGSVSLALLVSARASLTFHIRLRTDLNVSLDDFPHAPWVTITVRNLSWRKVRIAAVQFQTKQHWDIPDPRREGVTVPIARCLPESTPLIQLSIESGSIAIRAVGITLPARGTTRIQFRLITDHSPNHGFGIFPVHLGVELVFGNKNSRLSLPDILVSLHGGRPISELVSTAIMDPLYDRGTVINSANHALSVIAQGARSDVEILEILSKLAAPGREQKANTVR